MGNKKSREEIVEKCAKAALECFNERSDFPLLGKDEVEAVKEAIEESLPQIITREEVKELLQRVAKLEQTNKAPHPA